MTATILRRDFTIIIPTRACIAHLSTCLDRVYATTTDLDVEVLVVANGTDAECLPIIGMVEKSSPPVPTTVVRSPKVGPIAAINYGIAMATGDAVVVLQDDTLPGDWWLHGMDDTLRHLTVSSTTGAKFVLVSALTNKGVAVEDPNLAIQHDAKRLGDIVSTVREKRQDARTAVIPAATFSGVCFLARRAILQEVGPLDEQYDPTGGMAMADYALRLQRHGYQCCVSPQSFVFHYGQATLDRLALRYQEDGGENLPRFLYANAPEDQEDKRLIAAYLWDISTETQAREAVAGIESLRDKVDGVVILDLGSQVDTGKILREAALGHLVLSYRRNLPETPKSLARDRGVANDMARVEGAEWILALYNTERLDPAVTRAELQALTRPRNPLVRGYQLPVFAFWEGRRLLRVDGEWGDLRATALFDASGTWGDVLAADGNAVVGREPTCLPVDATLPTMVAPILSYDYAEPMAGDFRDATLLPYVRPDVTLLLMGRDEDEDVLRQVVAYGDLFTDICYVDTGSKASTLTDLLPQLRARMVEYHCCAQATEPGHMLCDFAAARNFAIDQVQTRLVLFMDPDEEVDPRCLRLLPKLPLQANDAWMVRIENLSKNGNGAVGSYPTQQARFFAVHPLLRYRDPIHESLEEALAEHAGTLRASESDLRILHYGFLKTPPEQRKWRNAQYAEKLQAVLAATPNNAKALFALGVHLNSEGNYDDGDAMIAKAVQLSPHFFAARMQLAVRLAARARDVAKDVRTIPADNRGRVLQQLIQRLDLAVKEAS